jgi:hypothetical protein
VITVPTDYDLCDICGVPRNVDHANRCEAHNSIVCNACEATGEICPPGVAPHCWRRSPRRPTITDDPFVLEHREAHS